MHKFILAAALLAAVGSAQATDLGVQGKTWPIIEVDFRQLLLESAARADLSAAQKEVKASTETFFDSFPQRYLPSVEATVTHYIDPSITIASDIMAPIPQNGGEYQWTAIVRKGKRVNPLEHYRAVTAKLF